MLYFQPHSAFLAGGARPLDQNRADGQAGRRGNCAKLARRQRAAWLFIFNFFVANRWKRRARSFFCQTRQNAAPSKASACLRCVDAAKPLLRCRPRRTAKYAKCGFESEDAGFEPTALGSTIRRANDSTTIAGVKIDFKKRAAKSPTR